HVGTADIPIHFHRVYAGALSGMLLTEPAHSVSQHLLSGCMILLDACAQGCSRSNWEDTIDQWDHNGPVLGLLAVGDHRIQPLQRYFIMHAIACGIADG